MRRGLAALAIAASIGTAGATEPHRLGELTLGSWHGVGDPAGEATVCIRVPEGVEGRIAIVVSGAGPDGALALTGGAVVPLALSLDDGTGRRDVPAEARALSGVRADAGALATGACPSERDVPLRVRVTARPGDLATVPAGRYSGAVVLSVLPD